MNTPDTITDFGGAVLNAALVREALDLCPDGTRPIDWLSERLAVDDLQFTMQVANHFRLVPMSMSMLRDAKPQFDIIPFTEATRRLAVAVRTANNESWIVTGDPIDRRTRAWIETRLAEAQTGARRWAFIAPNELRAFFALIEKSMRAMDSVQNEDPTQTIVNAAALSLSLADISASTSPVVRLVDSTLHDALKSDASDIHLESNAMGMAIKYRIDGVLNVVKRIEGLEVAAQVLSRIKVVSELDISERRVPQDGRFKVSIEGREIDLRVSIMPNLFGEDAVLRILDRKHLSGEATKLTLDMLGFDERVKGFVRGLAAMPYGLLLATGPTGSGKTTTLYAALSEIHTGLDKIITIEDPVEYQLHDVLQIPVNEKKGLTFAKGLRSILRHDPDKIMVGEIRDPETAQIAVQAALTGHQVFTSVHANNVFDVIGRFTNMGVDAYSFVSALNGIVAQRLLRVSCPLCTEVYDPGMDALRASRIVNLPKDSVLKRGLGCAHCRGTGYKGRRAIAETLPMTDKLRDLMSERAPLSAIKQEAHNAGIQTLRGAAIELFAKGETTLEEINRVTQVE
jgi:general secretion pathway protein E